MMAHNPDKIILGCTHYPYLLDKLSEFEPKDLFIDPAVYFAQFIKEDLEVSGMLEEGSGREEIYVSSNPENFKEASKMFCDLKELPKLY